MILPDFLGIVTSGGGCRIRWFRTGGRATNPDPVGWPIINGFGGIIKGFAAGRPGTGHGGGLGGAEYAGVAPNGVPTWLEPGRKT